jgi:hypothetical protein
MDTLVFREVFMFRRQPCPSVIFLCAAILVVDLAPSPAGAQGAAICNRISTTAEQNECISIVARQRVDPPAVQICGRISSNREIVECARAVAGQWMSPESPALCGRISTNQEIVDCARAVAGHALDAGAVGACGRISTNAEIVSCARAIADKVYAPEELAMCNGNGTNQGIVDCMNAAGAVPQPAAETQPQGSGSGGTVDLVNDTAGVIIARVYVRATGATRWPGSLWRGSLVAGNQVQLNLNPGRWDICAETPDGFSSGWRDYSVPPGGARLFLRGTTADQDAWSQMECTTWP